MIEVTLPMPPSVNALYRRSRGSFGMYKTAEAKAWINHCLWLLINKTSLNGDVTAHISFYFKRDRDIDNCLKATLDVIEEAGIVHNDSQFTELHVFKYSDIKNPRVELKLESKS